MAIRRKVSPWVSRTLTHPARLGLSRSLRELRRRLRRAPHRVEYFHQVDDPYCQLTAPRLEALVDRYGIELVPVLVGPPPDEAAPERDQLAAFSRKDTADIAPFYGSEFEDIGGQPPAELVGLANAILAANIEADRFAQLAAGVGDALWSGDGAALGLLAQEYGATGPETAARAVAAGNERRRKLGHYLAAMFHYAGEWYWGIERLSYLEERLEGLGLAAGGARVALRTSGEHPEPVRAGDELEIAFFASLRSPYTAIAFERVYQLVDRYGIRLEMKPVLPMLMRGYPVPPRKALYILLDTSREAGRAGIAFGNMADPIGRPVELGYSLFDWARERGRAREWLHEFARAAFADGIDMGSDAGLRRAVERAGLSWDEARDRLGNDDWRDEVEANRVEMMQLGLWGVPSFVLRGPAGEPSFATWGQDRLWLLEERIRERLGPAAAGAGV